MSVAGVIVVDVLSQDSPEVPLVEDDHVVETLAANATNHPFDVLHGLESISIHLDVDLTP